MTKYLPAPLSRRLFALIYESLLIGSVSILTGFVAGVINTQINAHIAQPYYITVPLTTILLLMSWWYYFKANWHLEGQTLAMRTWKIGLIDHAGKRPHPRRLLIRFLWASVLLIFVPLMIYAILQHMGWHGKTVAATALFWWILPWGYAIFDPRKQFLYDHLAGTELIDLRSKD